MSEFAHRVHSFEDNITATWNSSLIAEYVRPYLLENEINLVRDFKPVRISSFKSDIDVRTTFYTKINLQ